MACQSQPRELGIVISKSGHLVKEKKCKIYARRYALDEIPLDP